MKFIIIGHNRVESCTIKGKDTEKIFVRKRGQTYMIPPDALTRCKRTKYGRPSTDEEIIVFSENAVIPYETESTKKVNYQSSNVLGMVDLMKDLQGENMMGKKGILARTSNGNLAKMLPMLIGFGVLAYALISSGGLQI